MKILGMVMIFICSTLLGHMQGEYYRQRYLELIYLKKIVILIRGEIRYNCGILSEVFGNVAKKLKEPYGNIFGQFSRELNEGRGTLFFDIWKRVVIGRLSETKLWEKDVEGFKELGENMGYLDMEMQLNYIDFYIDKLQKEIQEAEEKLRGNIKLFKTLGIMGGLLIIILII